MYKEDQLSQMNLYLFFQMEKEESHSQFIKYIFVPIHSFFQITDNR